MTIDPEMITYDDLFPNVPDDFEPMTNDNVFKSSHAHDCWNCGRLTKWIDFSFETHLCSPECSETKWNEYYAALREIDLRPRDEEPYPWPE